MVSQYGFTGLGLWLNGGRREKFAREVMGDFLTIKNSLAENKARLQDAIANYKTAQSNLNRISNDGRERQKRNGSK